MNISLFIAAAFFLSILGAFAQISPFPEATATASPSATPTTLQKASLAALTPSERTEFFSAHQKAMMDPAVQSTRQISRIALHKAMLHADPSVETIIADMDAHGPQDTLGISTKKKSLGGNFQQWLNNFPAEATAKLTPEEREKLRAVHEKALQDPTVQETRKTAHLTFYNAMINADPLIAPILNKAGIPTPKSVVPLSGSSNVGSEEKILGGDFQAWGSEVLAPAIQKEDKAAAPQAVPSSSTQPPETQTSH